jgi:hypothetical protein
MKKSSIENNDEENNQEEIQPLNQNLNTINVKQSIDLGDLIKELKKDKPKRKYKKRQQAIITQQQQEDQTINEIINQQDTPNQPPIIVRNGDSAPQIIQGSQGFTPQPPTNDLGQKIAIPKPVENSIPEEMIKELENLYLEKTNIIKTADTLGITLPEEFIRSQTAQLPLNPTPQQIRTLIDEIYMDNRDARDMLENITNNIFRTQPISSNTTGTRPQQSISTNTNGTRPQQSITTNTNGTRSIEPSSIEPSSISTRASMPDLELRTPTLSPSLMPPTPNIIKLSDIPELSNIPDINELNDENLSLKELREKLRKVKKFYKDTNQPLPENISKSPGYQRLKKSYEVPTLPIIEELRKIRENQPQEFNEELKNRMIKNPQTTQDELMNRLIKLNNKPEKVIKPIEPKPNKNLSRKDFLINELRAKGIYAKTNEKIEDLQKQLDREMKNELNPTVLPNLPIGLGPQQSNTIDTLFSNYGPPKSFFEDVRDIRSGYGSNNTQGIQSLNIPPQTSLLEKMTTKPVAPPQRNLLGQALGGFSDFLSSSKGARDAGAYAGGALAIAQPELIPAIGIAETANQALNILENPLNSINRTVQQRIDNPTVKKRSSRDSYGGF